MPNGVGELKKRVDKIGTSDSVAFFGCGVRMKDQTFVKEILLNVNTNHPEYLSKYSAWTNVWTNQFLYRKSEKINYLFEIEH